METLYFVALVCEFDPFNESIMSKEIIIDSICNMGF